ncbi:MAG: hypothetical protein CHACPFDD_03649 [Phycisphaerae bacterium]|nr:hypothetical protein [Phycisphaerae bacterium]
MMPARMAVAQSAQDFQTPVVYETDSGESTYPLGLAVGDMFNDDDYPDLAVANSGSHSVSVFENLGRSGTTWLGFDTPTVYTMPNTGIDDPYDVEFADMDNDGDLDLVVTTSSRVVLLPNTGSGSFGTAQTLTPSGEVVHGLTVSDVDGDGRKDIAVGGLSEVFFDGVAQIEIFYQRSTLTFDPPQVIATEESFAIGSEVLSGTFKLPAVSGRRDLVMSIEGSDNVMVLLNLGDLDSDGTTDWATELVPAKSSFGLAKGKFRAGTNIDLVVSNHDTQACRVLWNDNSDGSYEMHSTPYEVTDGEDPYGVDCGKLNSGDTTLEIAVACAHGFDDGHGGLIVFVGNGDGTFDEPGYEFDVQPGNEPDPPYETYKPKPGRVKIEDIDQDGYNDVVTSNWNTHTISVLLNDQ